MLLSQLLLYSYIISSRVSFWVCVCACAFIPHVWGPLSFSLSLSKDLQAISLLNDWDGIWWWYEKCIEIRWPKEIGRSWQNLFTPNSVYAFAFCSFKTSTLWCMIVFYKIFAILFFFSLQHTLSKNHFLCTALLLILSSTFLVS